jgi:hypothetical protein
LVTVGSVGVAVIGSVGLGDAEFLHFDLSVTKRSLLWLLALEKWCSGFVTVGRKARDSIVVVAVGNGTLRGAESAWVVGEMGSVGVGSVAWRCCCVCWMIVSRRRLVVKSLNLSVGVVALSVGSVAWLDSVGVVAVGVGSVAWRCCYVGWRNGFRW